MESSQPQDTGPKKPTMVRLDMKTGSTKDIPVLYANGITVNYLGNEFIATVIAGFPEPWSAGEVPNPNVEGRVIGRFAFSPAAWMLAAASISEQIERLQREGAPLPDINALKATYGQGDRQ